MVYVIQSKAKHPQAIWEDHYDLTDENKAEEMLEMLSENTRYDWRIDERKA